MADGTGAGSLGLRGFGNPTGDGFGVGSMGLRGGNFSSPSTSDTTRPFAFPHPRTPLVDGAGLMTPEWWRFFEWFYQQKIGGPQSDSLPTVQTGVNNAAAVGDTNTFNVTQVNQMAVANAQALTSVVQVVQNAGLSGSSGVPPVVHTANLKTSAVLQ